MGTRVPINLNKEWELESLKRLWNWGLSEFEEGRGTGVPVTWKGTREPQCCTLKRLCKSTPVESNAEPSRFPTSWLTDQLNFTILLRIEILI